MESNPLIVATESDEPFAIDVAMYSGQKIDYSDIVALKTFANGEFCPRFIGDPDRYDNIGHLLDERTVVIVAADSSRLTRNDIAWHTCLLAGAAKDNGAKDVILVQPNLFFAAQDRGPREDQGMCDKSRNLEDFKKFDGQPFSCLLYARVLKVAGVDAVLTVHNHSISAKKTFQGIFGDRFVDLSPTEIFADYVLRSDVAPAIRSGEGVLLCAPDEGARAMALDIHEKLGGASAGVICLAKRRSGERSVDSAIAPDSDVNVEQIKGRDIVVVDDMVRTGNTIRECCRLLKELGAQRTVFCVTHYYSSSEVRENLNTPEFHEIVALNTMPYITNRDVQGRLRRKMTVLKIEKWLSAKLLAFLDLDASRLHPPRYREDMSAKNPRYAQRLT